MEAYLNREKKMADFCAALAALIEDAPSEATRRVLEVGQMLAGCERDGPVVTPQSGGGGPTNPPEPPK